MGADYNRSRRTQAFNLNTGNLAAGLSELMPALWIPIGAFSTDVDIVDLRYEAFVAGAWRLVYSAEGTLWVGGPVNQQKLFPMKMMSDGANLRVTNSGANQIDAIRIQYELEV